MKFLAAASKNNSSSISFARQINYFSQSKHQLDVCLCVYDFYPRRAVRRGLIWKHNNNQQYHNTFIFVPPDSHNRDSHVICIHLHTKPLTSPTPKDSLHLLVRPDGSWWNSLDRTCLRSVIIADTLASVCVLNSLCVCVLRAQRLTTPIRYNRRQAVVRVG